MRGTSISLSILLLVLARGAVAATWAPSCRMYPLQAEAGPSTSPVLSSMAITDAFDVASIAIDNLSIVHPQIGALKITLTAQASDASPTDVLKDTVTLKDVHEGGNATGMSDVVYDDDVMVPFPDGPSGTNSTVITGSFFPSQDLQIIALGNGTVAGEGGSNGTWTLRIVDLGADRGQRTITLQSWTLVLCPVIPPVAADAGPADPNALPESGAMTTDAEVRASLTGQTAQLLQSLLNSIDRVSPSDPVIAPFNGTLRPRAWLESAVNATSTVAASNGASNSSAMSADDTGGLLTTIRSRLDDLLGTDEAAASGAVPANASATPLLDSIAGVAGNNTRLGQFVTAGGVQLPQGPTTRLLSALRSLINDVVPAANASATTAAAPVATPRASTASAIASALRSVTTGTPPSTVPSTSASAASAPPIVAQSGPSGVGLLGSIGSGGLLSKLSGLGSGLSAADGSSLLSTISSLLTGNQYLDTIAGTLTSLQDAIQNIPVVKTLQGAAGKLTDKVQGKATAAASAVSTQLKSTQDFASQQVQGRVQFLQQQSQAIEASIKSKIDTYQNALTSASSLISAAIKQHSDQMIAHAQDIMDVSKSMRSQVTQQTSTAAKALTQHFDAMFKGSSGIQGVSKTLQSDFLSAVTQLFDVYKTQLQAAGDVLSAGTNAALSQAQFRAETAVDSLDSALTKCITLLDGLMSKTGPVLDQSLSTYKQGLTFIDGALKGLKSQILAAPTNIDLSQLASNVLQKAQGGGQVAQQLQQVTSSLGVGSRASKTLSLLGNMDGFSSRIAQLFPTAAGSSG